MQLGAKAAGQLSCCCNDGSNNPWKHLLDTVKDATKE
jgi:hypothetical protein